MRKCHVFINGLPAGVLEEDTTGYLFSYNPDYLKQQDALPVCAAMPLQSEAYHSPSLFPFFSNLLSEGSNRTFQERLHHLSHDDDFGLLLKTCTYDTIGNVTVQEI